MQAIQALTQQLNTVLAGLYPVYPIIAPANADMPFITHSIQTGGEDNRRGDRQDASFTVLVKCLASTSTEAFAGVQWISDRLNDRGTQDRLNWLGAMPAGWTITTCTQGEAVMLTELYQNTAWIYHAGYQFNIVMEAE